jgi:hypothetical protein
MGNAPLTFATGQTYSGYYWSGYKQAQDRSHSKYRSVDGTGYTIRGMVPSDGFSSPQRRPYAHWGKDYPDTTRSYKCAAHGYAERFATLAAVNSSSASRIKSTDDSLNAWGMRNMACGWSFGFICITKSESLLQAPHERLCAPCCGAATAGWAYAAVAHVLAVVALLATGAASQRWLVLVRLLVHLGDMQGSMGDAAAADCLRSCGTCRLWFRCGGILSRSSCHAACC